MEMTLTASCAYLANGRFACVDTFQDQKIGPGPNNTQNNNNQSYQMVRYVEQTNAQSSEGTMISIQPRALLLTGVKACFKSEDDLEAHVRANKDKVATVTPGNNKTLATTGKNQNNNGTTSIMRIDPFTRVTVEYNDASLKKIVFTPLPFVRVVCMRSFETKKQASSGIKQISVEEVFEKTPDEVCVLTTPMINMTPNTIVMLRTSPNSTRIMAMKTPDWVGGSPPLPRNFKSADLKALGIKDDSIKGIYVPAGVKVVLYSEDNFEGESLTMGCTMGEPRYFVGELAGWENKVSSLKIMPDKTSNVRIEIV
jgi:hypothetical protein